MNQFFLFRRINMIPVLFSSIKLDFTSIDKTCLEYAAEKYGRSIVFNFPLEMIDTGVYVKTVYPYNINIGVIDELRNLGEEYIDKLEPYDFIILYTSNIDEIVTSRSVIKKLRFHGYNFKRILILDARSKEYPIDDIYIFIQLSEIYDYRPVLILERSSVDKITSLLKVSSSSKCITKWFNYDVYIYVSTKTMRYPLSVLVESSNPDVKFISFKDCMALLCRGSENVTIASIIKYLYENAKPVLKIGDVEINEELLMIAESLMEYESIRLTSKSLGASYTKIRRIIKELEKLEKIFGVALMETKRGGSEHGKTTYTHTGRIVLNNIKELYGELIHAYSEITSRVLESLGREGEKPICVFPLSI